MPVVFEPDEGECFLFRGMGAPVWVDEDPPCRGLGRGAGADVVGVSPCRDKTGEYKIISIPLKQMSGRLSDI